MKKTFFLSIALFSFTFIHADVVIDDFENTTKSWQTVSCGSAIVDNPYQTGLNLSCKALQITRAPGCDNWSGAIYTLPSSQSGYNYVHALMYRNNTGTPNVKVTDNGDNLDVAPMTAVVANQWQDVVFDISGKSVDFVMFMADRGTLTEDAVVYIDDVILSNDATPRTTPNTACGSSDNNNDDNNDTPSTGGYELVWNQDFVNTNFNNWNIEVNDNGGGNSELQYYCEEAVTTGKDPIEGKHCLILTATKEEYKTRHCTSGRVNSLDKTYFTYGKIEARIWFPKTANGLWPAFWMMGNNYSSVGWPRCGETDIIELGHSNGFNNRQETYFSGATHVGAAWDSDWCESHDITWDSSVEDGFHVVTCEWTPTDMRFYMDKDLYPTRSPYFTAALESNEDENYNRALVFSRPQFIIFNLAIGGNFPGIYDINAISALADGPRKMYIDWVRIYQRGDAGQTFYSVFPSEEIEVAGTPSEEEDPFSAIETTTRPIQPNSKFIRNGQMYIIMSDGKTYNTIGQRIK